MTTFRQLEAQAQQAIIDDQLQQMVASLSPAPTEWNVTSRFLLKLVRQGATLVILLITLLAAAVILRGMIWFRVEYWVGLIGLVAILCAGLVGSCLWAYFFLPLEALWREVVIESLPERRVFSLNRLHHKAMRGQLYQVLIYWGRIEAVMRQQSERPFPVSRQQIITWLWATYRLAYQGDQLHLSLVKSRQLQHLPALIEQDERQLSRETDPHCRQHIEQLLAHRRQQWATFQTLRDKRHQLQQQLDRTVAAWGAMDTQLLLVQHHQVSRETFNNHALPQDIAEQIACLQDLTAAVIEVQSLIKR